MMVKFATTCDIPGCAARSAEYTAWPSCRDCGEDICPAHQQTGSKTEADEEHAETCLCVLCPKEEDAEAELIAILMGREDA